MNWIKYPVRGKAVPSCVTWWEGERAGKRVAVWGGRGEVTQVQGQR
jgi:hypothetical protein